MYFVYSYKSFCTNFVLSGDGNDSNMDDDDDDDAEYYRQEVGQEPDPGICTNFILDQITC